MLTCMLLLNTHRKTVIVMLLQFTKLQLLVGNTMFNITSLIKTNHKMSTTIPLIILCVQHSCNLDTKLINIIYDKLLRD